MFYDDAYGRFIPLYRLIRRPLEDAARVLDTHTVFVVWFMAALVVVVLLGIISARLVPHVHQVRRFRK
jgi:hypothetical protein